MCLFKESGIFGKVQIHGYLPITISTLTYLTVGAQVAGPGTVTDVAVPALFAQSSVATGGAATPLLQFAGAEAANTKGALDLSQAADIAALAVDEEVTHTAHVAVVEQCGPNLRRQDEVRLGLGQAAQEHIAVQVQDLTALRGAEGHAAAVDRD